MPYQHWPLLPEIVKESIGNGNGLIQREQIIDRGIVRGSVQRTAAAIGGGRSQHFLIAFSADDDTV